MSKATLYTFKLSVWSAAADVARIELGLADEIEPQQVDLLNAENMSPAFLKKVPSSTLPAIIDGSTVHSSCTEVIDYMVKKSSTKVTPRTELSTIVHADDVDPNFMLIAARDETEVGVKGSGLAGFFLSTRVGKMKEFVSTPDAEPFKAAIEAKIIGTSGILAIYNGTAPAEAKAQFIAKSKATFDAAGKVIYETLPSAISSGPFIAGATPGEDDFHVIAWLSRTALTLGAEKTTDTAAVFEKTYEKPLPDSIKALLDAWSSRESYKSTYAEGKNH